MTPRIAVAVALSALASSAHAADALRGTLPPYTPSPPITGDLAAGVGVVGEGPGGGTGLGLFAATGRANFEIQGPLNVEIQGSANALLTDGDSEKAAYAHAWERMPGSAWGLFGGAQFASAGGTVDAIGAEAKRYGGNMSIGVETAYLWEGTSNAWEFGASANAYMNSNHRIGISAQYFSGFGGLSLWNATIDGEARLAGAPWSLWGSAAYSDLSGTTGWTGLVGVRLFLDAPNATLQSHERDVPFRFDGFAPGPA